MSTKKKAALSVKKMKEIMAKQPIVQSKISKLTTEEMTAQLAKRGFVVHKHGEVLNKYPIPEEKCVETGYTEFGAPDMRNAKSDKSPISRLQVVFSQASESNDYLRENVILLENKARTLFGYDVEVAEPKSEEARDILYSFTILGETRTALMDRLARVAQALAEFIG